MTLMIAAITRTLSIVVGSRACVNTFQHVLQATTVCSEITERGSLPLGVRGNATNLRRGTVSLNRDLHPAIHQSFERDDHVTLRVFKYEA
jgi:hypothetical protein